MLAIDLTGKVAVVTGVTSGIGAGIAKMLAKAGCKIAGCARSPEDSPKVKEYYNSMAEENCEAIYNSVDVTNPEHIKNFIDVVISRFKGIDILVSNAGINVFHDAEKATEEDWDFNNKLNLRSHWLISREAKPWLEKAGPGVIIIMTSNHAYNTLKGCFPYNIAKAGLVGMAKTLAVEWGPKIRTVGIAPGFIVTEGTGVWFDSFENPDEEYKKTVDIHPVKRLGSVDEIGAFCAFLASDYAGFMSGTTYLIDGGRSAVMQDI